MAAITEEDRNAFTEAYRFYEQHWDMPDTAEEWDECARHVAEIIPKYEDKNLIGELLMACYSAIDRRRAEIRKILNATV